jgi:hypothetical protein
MTSTAKTIVTHLNPDLDAIAAVWLLKRHGGKEYKNAEVKFVPAGERMENEDNNTVHVDTGLGKFDHHQTERGEVNTSATQLVYEWLVQEKKISGHEELNRIVRMITDIDHFREYYWPEPVNDRYLFFLEHVLHGVKLGSYVKNDEELVKLGMLCLDGVQISFKIRISAEENLKEGITFETRWGKSLGVETANTGVLKLALKSGYKVVVRRDPGIGSIRIKAAPIKEINLKKEFNEIKKEDPEATWFFHPSGKMILNGSIRNPEMVPSKLKLDEVVEILKKV